MIQYYLRTFRPALLGLLTKLLYAGSVKFGRNFRCDSIPRILVDKGATVEIGDKVEFRRNLEIRAHGTSRITIASGVRIDRGVRVLAANQAHIDIARGARIGLYTVLNGGDSISIGEKALVSGFVYLQTSMHGYAQKNVAVQEQGYEHAPVILEEDAWLGTHVVILPGVTVGRGSVVGSNAVVTRTVAPYKVMGGIPARELKERS